MTMWPFKRRERPDPPGVALAREAERRAIEDMQAIRARTGEVDTYVAHLRRRRLENNFGDALAVAMERR